MAAFAKWRVRQDQAALVEGMRAIWEFEVSAELLGLEVPTLILTGLGDTLAYGLPKSKSRGSSRDRST